MYLRAGGVPTRGTHTNGTAYTRGTYSRVAHTNTHTHKQTHSAARQSVYVSLLLGAGAGAAVDLLALATRAVPLVIFLHDL